MRVCKFYILVKGLKGTDKPHNCDYIFEDSDEEGFMNHLEKEHGYTITDRVKKVED